MHVLLTNDDGYFSRGIKIMAAALAKEYKLTVVAPDIERSGAGASLTMDRALSAKPMRYDGVDADVFAVSGTPVDCVKLGKQLAGNVDFVVSGINHGANLGNDVLCSGTASAALDAAINGLPAVAISIASFDPEHLETAAQYCMEAIRYVRDNPLPRCTMLNVNVPDLVPQAVRGVKFTRLALLKYNETYMEVKTPQGRSHYYLHGAKENSAFGDDDSDMRYISEGYVTMTPVHYDLTNENYLAHMRAHRG